MAEGEEKGGESIPWLESHRTLIVGDFTQFSHYKQIAELWVKLVCYPLAFAIHFFSPENRGPGSQQLLASAECSREGGLSGS